MLYDAFDNRLFVLIITAREVVVSVHEKLNEICEEIFSDEKETQKFLSFNTLDEMYNYFSKKIPQLGAEEFDEFIYDALEKCVCLGKDKVRIDDELENLSGGVGFKKKIPSALLSFSLLLPSGAANTKAFDQLPDSFQTLSSKLLSGKEVISNHYKKIKSWADAHPEWVLRGKITAAIAIALLLNRSENLGPILRSEPISAAKSKFNANARNRKRNNNIRVIRTGMGNKYMNGIVSDDLLKDLSVDNKTTAIVDASNCSGLGGGGVDGYIFDAMGESRAQRYIKSHLSPYPGKIDDYTGLPVRIKTGGAIIHNSFNIAKRHHNVSYVIQAVSPHIDDQKAFPLLYSAYYNAIKLGVENGCKRFLVPALGMAIFLGDNVKNDRDFNRECAKVAINAINDALEDSNAPEDVEIIFTDHGSGNVRPLFYQGMSDLGIREYIIKGK